MAWLQEQGTTLLLIAGLVAFLLRGPVLARATGVETLTVHDLARQLSSSAPPLLLDVRSPAEFATGHVPNAILIPLPELRQRLDELRPQAASRAVAVICRSGNRSLHGAVLLKRSGFPQVVNVAGGIVNWKIQGYPLRG
ncbi:MAG: rhodanese-like domain-containing protein [Magnetococcales bacterium]|nr:rhodanese-like domain-containing protein [Magnetococcales bacterium]MBF0584027.1 rhodanese-like domain-containing protein [Magnetococcales bacterium]